MKTLFNILNKEKNLIEKYHNLQQEELKNNAPLKQQKQTYKKFEKEMKKLEKEKKECLSKSI